MARPRKPDAQKRTDQVTTRFSPAERLQVWEQASKAGMTPSEYIREQALKGRVIIHQSRRLDHAVFDQLRRIGVNLNQITRQAHQTGEIPGKLTETLASLERLINREFLDESPAPDAKEEFASASNQNPTNPQIIEPPPHEP